MHQPKHIEYQLVDAIMKRHIEDELVLKVHYYSLNIVFGMCCQRGRSMLSYLRNFKEGDVWRCVKIYQRGGTVEMRYQIC